MQRIKVLKRGTDLLSSNCWCGCLAVRLKLRLQLLSANACQLVDSWPPKTSRCGGNISKKSQGCCSKKKRKNNALYCRSATVCFQISGKQMTDEEARQRKIEREERRVKGRKYPDAAGQKGRHVC